MSALIMATVAIAVWAVTSAGGARCAEIRLLEELRLPEGRGGLEIHVSYDLPSETGSPVLVCARRREIWYVDMGNLKLLRTSAYTPSERPTVSSNGKYVAVVSWTEDRETGSLLTELSVEDWQGELYWKKPSDLVYWIEPTSQGDLVAYPTPISTTGEVPSSEFRRVPKRRSRGLEIYDAAGALVLESLDYREISVEHHRTVSGDGRYLAYAYGEKPASRLNSEALMGIRVCLVLYDIEELREMWRKRFPEARVIKLAVTPHAERIFCLTTTSHLDSSRVYLLDRGGNHIGSDEMKKYDVVLPFIGPVFSPNGGLCAFTVRRFATYLIRMEDGTTVWEMGHPGMDEGGDQDIPGIQPGSGLSCNYVTNGGSAVFFFSEKDETTGEYDRHLVVVGDRGSILHRFDLDEMGIGRGLIKTWLSEDETSVVVYHGSVLRRYAIVR